ncbi:MAG: SusD/RagB family nutrient-binding outer membrane lipoprotein [Prevotellaceae bacterium]|nr:SusD/RagB family nutrient-binding outer membrane lipoprotein [Candidatus Minthosoma caballi]
MKKILSIALSSMLLLTACDMDINENPNYPSGDVVTTDLIFPSAENFIADAVGDQMFNYAGFFAQYWDQYPTANQYNDLAELNINESSDLTNRCYYNLYAGALEDLHEIMTRTSNTADVFACTVLRAYAFQLLVDNYSDCPYTEALQGTANLSPKWDSGDVVYEGVIKEMEDAAAALEESPAMMTVTDPLLKKNVNQWVGFANALKLRMLLRLIDGGINVAENTSKAVALVKANKFFSGDVMWDVYSNSDGQYNPWYAGYSSLTKNHCAAYPIISYMKATNDPRISYAFAKRSLDGTYVGQFPGAKTTEYAWIGLSVPSEYKESYVSEVDYEVAKSMPIYLYTQSELKFLIAEVKLRFQNDAEGAKDAYNAAIAADFASRDIPGASEFLADPSVAWASASTQESKLNLIYMQKWVALFYRDHMEAWTELRRTNVPAVSELPGKAIYANEDRYVPGQLIVPDVNHINAGGVALRVPYPSNARIYNKNTPAAKLLSDPVFWDKK